MMEMTPTEGAIPMTTDEQIERVLLHRYTELIQGLRKQINDLMGEIEAEFLPHLLHDTDWNHRNVVRDLMEYWLGAKTEEQLMERTKELEHELRTFVLSSRSRVLERLWEMHKDEIIAEIGTEKDKRIKDLEERVEMLRRTYIR